MERLVAEIKPSGNLKILHDQLLATLPGGSGCVLSGISGTHRIFLMKAVEILLLAFIKEDETKLGQISDMLDKVKSSANLPEIELWELVTVIRTVDCARKILQKKESLMKILRGQEAVALLRYLSSVHDYKSTSEISQATGLEEQKVLGIICQIRQVSSLVLCKNKPSVHGKTVETSYYSLSYEGKQIAALTLAIR